MDLEGHSSSSLVRTLLANLSVRLSDEMLPYGELDKKLQDILTKARRQWPGVNLGDDEFTTHLGQRLRGDSSPVRELDEMHTNDLFLCAAIMNGNYTAQRSFFELTLSLVKSSLTHPGADHGAVDEIHQKLLERLVSPGADNRPRLAQYNGKSSLISWLRVIIVRTILNSKKTLQPKSNCDEGLLEILVADDDQELAYFKSLYKAEFKKAIHQAYSKLSEDEKNLLSYHLIEQLTLEKISEIYQVNCSTIFRRLKKLRENLETFTREAMMEHLNISPDEFESIMGLIASRFDASLGRILVEDTPSN